MVSEVTTISPEQSAQRRNGSLQAIGAYGMWAVLPLVYVGLGGVGPVEILAMRILISLVFCIGLLYLLRQWAEVFEVLRSGRTTAWLALAAVLISVNWLIFIIATVSGRVLETSLAYFINPLMTVLISVIFLGERLRRLQWVAIGFGAIAVVVITVGYGRLPYLSLLMATSFALYGTVKRHITQSGHTKPVPALAGLTIETAVLAPIALVVVLVMAARGELVAFSGGWTVPVLLLTSGIGTALPLLLFAGAAARLPLSWVGMFQYIAPVGHFLIGWALLGEPMPAARWAGFALVWVAVLIFIVDAVGRRRPPAADRARSGRG